MNFWKTPEDEKRFTELIKTVIKEPILLFVGAGISKRAGYPLWRELLKFVYSKINEIPEHEGFIDNYNYKDNPKKQAQVCKNLIGDDVYAIIFDRFTNEEEYDIREFTDIHTYISQINKFKNILTTNYDTCLEKAFELDRNEWFPNCDPSLLFNDNKQIFHIHGQIVREDINSVRSIIFTEDDYSDVYNKLHMLPGFLNTCFLDFSILFIGFAMDEFYINGILERVIKTIDYMNEYAANRNQREVIRKKHFAILDTSENDNDEFDKKLLSIGVEPIRYNPTPYYKECKDIIKLLKERIYQNEFINLDEKDPSDI